VSKKLQAKQERRLAEERRRQAQRKAARQGNLVTAGIIALVALVVVALIAPELMGRNEAVGGDAAQAGCTDVQIHESEGNTHVEQGTRVDYQTEPPTSGDHYGTPADPGFYTTEIPAEALVHNLEHGQMVIWYRPDAPASVREDIEALTEQEPIATLAVPYENVPDGYAFSMTAWGASQSCDRVSQEVVDDFRRRFQGKGPERVRGIPTFG
jgi:uncharacterized protein DUF3105